jgi:hypothetical protein
MNENRNYLEEENDELTPKWLRELKNSYNVISLEGNPGKYTINTQSHGIIDFFPKKNRVLIRATNEWTDEDDKGLNWIVDNIIEHEKA